MKPAPPDQGESPSRPPEDYFERLIESLPAAVYATDAEGLIQTCNAAAVALWGRAPAIGAEAWCGSHRIFRPDGSALPLDECPMAVALREGRSLPPEEVVIERPDGSRRRVLAHPQALKDSAGRVIGAVNMLVDISEYHEAEKAQALLASIVASSDDAIISKTLEGRITSWNEAARRIFGYSAEEAVGQFAGMLIPEERLSEEGKILDMLRRGERVDHFETIRVAKDGRRIDVSLTISPVCDRRGVIIGASKVAHDITNQKAAALALWQSEERLRLATQTGKVGIWDWDIDANRMVWSNSLHLTHGVSREASDATIEGFTALLHPEDQECFSTAIQNALDDVKPFELEFRVQRPDGGVAWLYTHALVLREGTRPVRILGATLDITQRKRAEVALCESEERYRTLAESMPFVVWQSDAQGGILYANRFFQEYSGWSADTFLASEWSPLIHPDDLENAQRRFGHSLQTGESFRSTHRLKRADGNWRWFDFSAEPVWDESGQVNRWVGAAIDIDARKRAEAKLAAVTEDLALEVHGLSRLHDLATHLAVAPELDTALSAILSAVVDIHGAQRGLLSLFDRERNELYEGASIGFDPALASKLARCAPALQATVCARSFTTKQRVVVEDTEADPDLPAVRDAGREAGFKAVHSTPILTRSGEVLGVLSIHFDSPRKPTMRELQFADMCARYAADAIEAAQSKAALRESEQRFRNMANTAPAMLWISEPDAGHSFLSRGWGEFTGRLAAEGLAFGWLDCIHPKDREIVRSEFLLAHRKREAFLIDYRIRNADGIYRWVIDTGRPRFDAAGTYLGHIGSIIDIEDRHRAEEQRREAGALLEGSIDALNSHIAILDQNGLIVKVNAAWRRFAADNQMNSANAGVGLNYLDICRNNDTAIGESSELIAAVEGIGKVVRGELPGFDLEYPCRGPDERRWFVMHVTRFGEGDGLRLVVSHEDVTQRREAEQELRDSAERLRLATAATNLGTWDFNPITGALIWDDRCKELFGLPAEARVDYAAFLAGLHSDDRNRVESLVRDALNPAGSGEFHTEYRTISFFDGMLRWLHATGRVIFENGVAVRFIGTVEDITENKAVEAALHESERRTRAVLEGLPQLIATFRPDGYCQFLSSRWVEYTGVPEREQLGYKWLEQVHAEDHDRVVRAWQAAVKRESRGEEPNYRVDFRLRRRDGVYRWFATSAEPLYDSAGKLIRWVGSSTDIQSKRDAETALIGAKESAEAANQAKDRFLAVLSHELRTPLTPVLMSLEGLEARPDVAGAVREDVGMIRRNVELEIRLIDDLLDMSRVINGKLRLHSESVDVNTAVRDACDICQSQLEEKRLALHAEYAEEAGAVTVDPARLRQVLWNVLKNAAKFTPEGGDIYVRTLRTPEGRVRVEIRDTGIGIAPEVLPRIFDAFEQGDGSIVKQFGGLGLGLAISKAVMELHGGTIHAHSAGIGKGSTFTIEMAAGAPVREKPPMETPVDQNASPRSVHLLLVEDHVDTAKLLGRMLTHSGYRVKTANTVAAAMRLATDEAFDVIVSDIGLPDATGYELMQHLRAKHPVKGVAMSGYGTEEDIRKSRDAGFCEHVVKPVLVEQLEQAIQRALANGN